MSSSFGCFSARSRTQVWGRDLHVTPGILRNKGFPCITSVIIPSPSSHCLLGRCRLPGHEIKPARGSPGLLWIHPVAVPTPGIANFETHDRIFFKITPREGRLDPPSDRRSTEAGRSHRWREPNQAARHSSLRLLLPSLAFDLRVSESPLAVPATTTMTMTPNEIHRRRHQQRRRTHWT